MLTLWGLPGSPHQDLCHRFGQAVRERRLELGLSQEKFAAAAGINRTYIGDVERGRRNVSLRNIEKIARALKFPISELLQCCEPKR